MGEDKKSPGSNRFNLLYPAFIFSLSFIVHLIYLLEVRSCPLFDYPILDIYWHREWAYEILSGRFMGNEVFFRAPLYPYFLATVMLVAGDGFFWPRVIQALVGSLTPALVYLVAFRLENSRGWAMAAGTAAALYPPIIFFNTEFLIPVIALPLNLALVLSLIRLKGARPGLGWALPGVLLGLSAIARPTILAFGAGILVWLVFIREEKGFGPAIKRAAIILGASLVVIAPVTIRNYIVGKDLVLISSQGGVNFWIGNNENADGKTSVSPGIQVSHGPYRDSVWLASELEAEHALGRELKPSEISRYWLKRGLNFVTTNPAESIPLFLKKIYFLVNGFEIQSNQSIYFYRQESRLMRSLLWPGPIKFPFGLLLPLAGAGMFMLIKRRRDYSLLYLFVLTYSCVVVAFFVNARFRLPLVPFMIVFAVFGIKEWKQALNAGMRARALAGGIIFLVLFVVSNSCLFDVDADDVSKSYRTIGYNYYEKQEYDKAKEYFIKAYEQDPDTADNNNAIANIYFLENNFKRALEYYRRAAFLKPRHPEIYFNIAMTYEALGRYREAERHYVMALKIAPDYQRARENLKMLMIRQGKITPKQGEEK